MCQQNHRPFAASARYASQFGLQRPNQADVAVGHQEGETIHFLCKCSYLEIYNETITDLLSLSDSTLHIREDIKQGVYVEGLMQEEVTNGKLL